MRDTPNHNYNTPEAGTEDWHEPLNENFEKHDTDIEIRDVDSSKNEYEPVEGAKFLATDRGIIYIGNGSEWESKLILGRYIPPTEPADFETNNIVFGHSSNFVATYAAGGTISGGGGGASSDFEHEGANRIINSFGTVGGGQQNEAGLYATVSGGRNNRATGLSSVVPGGFNNKSSGEYSFATGREAKAQHDGAFIFGDSSPTAITSESQDEVRFQMPVYAPNIDGQGDDESGEDGGVSVHQMSPQPIESGIRRTVRFDEKSYDDFGDFDTEMDFFNAPEDGRYQVVLSVATGPEQITDFIAAFLLVNGEDRGVDQRTVPAGNWTCTPTVTKTIELAKGDLVRGEVYHEEGETVDTQSGEQWTYMTIDQIA